MTKDSNEWVEHASTCDARKWSACHRRRDTHIKKLLEHAPIYFGEEAKKKGGTAYAKAAKKVATAASGVATQADHKKKTSCSHSKAWLKRAATR